MLGVSPFRFVFKYSFMAYSFLVLAGLLAGVVTVPLLLGIAGPGSKK